MGGKAFSAGANALYTPRMDRKVYEIVLAQCFDALKAFFPVIKSPIETPEKTTFGDVDIFVSLEGSNLTLEEINDPTKTAIWTVIEKQLRAAHVSQEGSLACFKSIAIPWPVGSAEDVMAARQLAAESMAGHKAESERGEASTKAVEPGLKATPKRRFIQVDIQLCSTKKELEWRVFKHDHGDMWSILGAMIRPYGLTVNEEALYIRIADMEQVNKKKARVFLTDSPAKVLEFVMQETPGGWSKCFHSVDEMFNYAARCRWFRAWLFHENEKNAADIKDNLTSNDRQRMRQRPVFARWVEEFVPREINSNRSLLGIDQRTSTAVRNEVRAAAFAAFPGAKDRYTQQLAAWNKEQNRIFVKNKLIKEDRALPESIACALPKPQEGSSVAQLEKKWRGVLRSALIKLIVEERTDFECACIAPADLRDEQGVLIIDEVKDWIEKNWETVGRAAWAEQCARAGKHIHTEAAQRLCAGQHARKNGEKRQEDLAGTEAEAEVEIQQRSTKEEDI